MRALILGSLALALGAGCGSSSSTSAPTPDGGSGRTSPAQVNLKITTTGDGLVRGVDADCRGSCTAAYASGTQVHLVAVPDSGASFVAWSGACSGTGTCDLTLDGDRELSATFATLPPPPPNQHRLSVIVQGKGRVISSPGGLDCDSSTCAADFAAGTSVTLTATADSGFSFAGWGTDCSGGGDCTVTLSKDATVYANFVVQPPPLPSQVHLSASTNGPGTITGAGLNCGDSSSTCDVTLASGSTVTLTATATGGARFAGWGGACSGMSATCQLTLQADTSVKAEFRFEALVLAPNDETNGTVIALNSTRVFWTRDFSGIGRSIWSISKNGGDAVRVANGSSTASASAFVADEGNLYWTDYDHLYSTPVGGGQETLLFTGSPIGRLALDETGAVYWTVGQCCSGDNSGSVHRMQNRTHTVLAEGQNPTGAVAVDASYVYFTAFDGHAGSIRRVPRNGGAVNTVLSCGSGRYPEALAVDPQNVYFRLVAPGSATIDAHVQVMSKADCRVSMLSTGNGSGDSTYSYLEVEVNASVAYWNWPNGTSPHGIFRSNADGSGFGTVDSANDGYWYGLRVDDVAVYYYHYGAIIRRLK